MIWIIIASAGTGIALGLLALVVAGIRQEPPGTRLTSQPPSRTAALTRWITGASVRRPAGEPEPAGRDRCLARTGRR